MSADKVRSPAKSGRPYPRVGLRFNKPSKTRQSETAATSLQGIISRYGRVNIDRLEVDPSLQFGDVSELPSSRLEAMELMRQATDAFLDLPFKIRQAINHDPRLLEQWIVANPQQAYEAGLLRPNSPQSSPSESPSSSGTDEGKKKQQAKPDAGDAA